MKLTREEIEQNVEAWLCQLANVNNPDHTEKAVKELPQAEEAEVVTPRRKNSVSV